MINIFHFDDTNTWLSTYGFPPKAFSGITGVPSWQSNAVQIIGTSAFLQYNETETNGNTNIVCPAGTIWMWFLPHNWNSGTGPGVYGRLLDIGTYTTNASIGWFSLYFDPKGTNIFFSGQTNGAGATYLTGSVALTTNDWTFIALSYSQSNSFLFTNGTLCASGPGVAYYPGANVRSNGFFIGSDSSGANLAQGRFDWMRTYNYQLDAGSVSNFYNLVLNRYFGGGGDGPSGPNGPLAGGCVTNGDVFMTNVVATLTTNSTLTVNFDILGGTNGLLYDVFSTTNFVGSYVTNSLWVWLGSAPTCWTVELTNQPVSQTTYVLGTPQDSDADGLTDAYERLISRTDPNNPDTDGDGLSDWYELAVSHTDPFSAEAAPTLANRTISKCPVP